MKITAYKVTGQADVLADGVGHQKTLGYFSTEALAYEAAKYRGGALHSPRVERVEIVVYETLTHYDVSVAEEARRIALSKLSPEDIKALGLGD